MTIAVSRSKRIRPASTIASWLLPSSSSASPSSTNTRVLVVDKDDFSARRWYQLPAGFGFHHGNGWEDASEVIRFDHCVAADAALLSETMCVIMRGEVRGAAPELYTRFTLHSDGRAEVEATSDEAEFPRVAPAVMGRRNRYVYTIGGSSRGVAGPGTELFSLVGSAHANRKLVTKV